MDQNQFETVIGLEVHVQLRTESKIFCACSTEFAQPPNTNVCPVCAGYPGVLPVLNRAVLALAVRVASAFGCTVQESIYFERKNYFYPDLPKNYQISQYKVPLGKNGGVELETGRTICVERVHLEEDAGKLTHKEGGSLVDLNRAGTPLLEIVSMPDIRSPREAFEYLRTLKMILQYIEASDCDMEKGSLRCDANISLRRRGEERLGTKVELKNMNSFRGVRDALTHEQERQKEVLCAGRTVVQETRLWNVDRQRTESMRTKEEAHDYRYFPDPDLPDFSVPDELIAREAARVGELPLARKKRFAERYSLDEGQLEVLVGQKALGDFFEAALKYYSQPREIAKWIIGPFLEQVNALPQGMRGVSISSQNFAKIVQYFSEGKLNNLAAKKVLATAVLSTQDVDEIIREQGLEQISGEDELAGYVRDIISEQQEAVSQYLSGKTQAVMFLVGQVMKKTRGNANPKKVKALFEKELEKKRS
ncbi:MAG: Asp-tRNA(Asn)/Glu-tRNA(Gln) amidotransferase subunit GatB [Candidatus Omnitrophica bacterium]|nr:Asp-tRNA(Asn)/Glu-tRNA(Gln) amidotransferase subunit GatB [Candidatus Omnitrophota bacterium]